MGLDEWGHEVLSFLPGLPLSQGPASALWSKNVLVEAAQLMRRLHDASVVLIAESHLWRQESRVPVEVICHNDFAPRNMLVDDEHLVGVIDFDRASSDPQLT